MKTAVVYLISGPAHLPNLVVSLNALRRHWEGDVLVFTWDESRQIVDQIASDPRLKIRNFRRRPSYRGRNAQFFDKIRLMQELTEYGRVLYLDADTIPFGDVNDLFSISEQFEFLGTQFNDWMVKKNGLIAKRIQRLREFEEIDPKMIDRLFVGSDWPSVNGGVFVADPKSEILSTWERWTNVCKESVFIADEAVLHVVMAAHHLNFGVAWGGAWNASPKYSSLPDHEIKILHTHGDSNLRPNKSPRGVKIWWNEYLECRAQNVGMIREWDNDIPSDYFQKLRMTPMDVCLYCGTPLEDDHKGNCPDRDQETEAALSVSRS